MNPQPVEVLRIFKLLIPFEFLTGIVALLVLQFGGAASAEEFLSGIRAGDVISIHIEPEVVHLGGKNRQQQLLVTAQLLDGSRVDLTHRCQMQVEDPGVASVVESQVVGVRDGETTLTTRVGTVVASVSVKVNGYGVYPPVHFCHDIIPLITKLGCNGSSCHGKQAGQNGFKLSVFGFDPRADYVALTREARGRRVFPAAPERSLLILKATASLPHGGGRLISHESSDAHLIAEWVRQGMSYDSDRAPSLVQLTVSPEEQIVGMGFDQQLLVMAEYSDGSFQDVTSDAAYTSNAEIIAGVNPGGIVRAGQMAGEAAVTISYMGHVTVARIFIPRFPAPDPYPDLPANNHIDELVWSKLRKMGLVPSQLCDDSVFLRRLYLDTIGTLPTIHEVRDFLARTEPDKRQRAIENVLSQIEFADYWALKWADILLVNRAVLGERGAYQFHQWIREQIVQNRGYDEWVRDLITASGNSGKYGPVNFYRALRTPEELTRSVSQAFLGIRLNCAQCHHHPYDKWSQQDFYGLAGFFNGIERKILRTDREFVYHRGYQQTKLPTTGEIVFAKPPDGAEVPNFTEPDPRLHLANWLTGANNPWFARLVANRIWKHFLGRGLVEPEDDLRLTNPATNEPLLAYLEEQVRQSQFDLKQLMRLILNSRAYQLSSVPNETNASDEQNFSHYTPKRLGAEVLLDAICHVTGTPEDFPGMPRGTRAIQLWDNYFPSYFLETFGRSERTSPCECGKSDSPTVAQTLHLMNSPETEAKISDVNGRVARLLEQGLTEQKIVEELCLAALGRLPVAKEQDVADQLFAGAPVRQATEDFLWTLLNSYDFLLVH